MTRRASIWVMVWITLLATDAARAQTVKRDPHIGYLYPAGGQRGTTVQILVGGQFLRNCKQLYISGEGVSGKVVKFYPPMRNLNGDQRMELRRRMYKVAKLRWEAMAKKGQVPAQLPWHLRKAPPAPKTDEPVKLPQHYLLEGWDQLSFRELAYVRKLLADRSKQQPNAQIGETVLIELSIDADAAPGDRELRLRSREGLTNPLIMQVGQLPEAREIEGNDPTGDDPLPAIHPLSLPVVINGQIMPGDVDRIRFNARKGQELVIETRARHLVPFLADAVPGWFQPTLAVYDSKGRELAFADDFRFDPDPVLLFKPPANGTYELEIRDSIYRGRQDFVYRVTIGEFPFVTSVFPLGMQRGKRAQVRLTGWHLPTNKVELHGESVGIGTHAIEHAVRHSNTVRYQASVEKNQREREPNNTRADAQALALPIVINGRIDRDGDVDVYRVSGKAGDWLVAKVTARKLGSPLDSVLKLRDASGKVLKWNDDRADKTGHLHRGMGVLTHFADAHLGCKLPADGEYFLEISDVTGHGGPASGYRLYLGPPRQDFRLIVEPSAVNIPTGGRAVIKAHALRLDGFSGPINLSLVDAPKGFGLDGAVIPAGADHVKLTVVGPTTRSAQPIELKLQGTARIDGRVVMHRASPADDVMQAFLWRHLLPSRQWLATVAGSRRASIPPKRVGDGTIHLQPGKSQPVTMKTPPHAKKLNDFQLKLLDPPAGIAIRDVQRDADVIRFNLCASKDARVGLCGNAIVEASVLFTWKSKNGKQGSRRHTVGILPAVPFVVEKLP
jgi:hypothetical protein